MATGVRSMEVLSASYTTTSTKNSTGQWITVPNGMDSAIVSFTRYFTGDPAFVNAFQAQNGLDGAEQGSAVVSVHGRKGSVANTFTLSDCFPVSWQGPTYDAAVMAKGGAADRPTESISIAFQKIEVK